MEIANRLCTKMESRACFIALSLLALVGLRARRMRRRKLGYDLAQRVRKAIFGAGGGAGVRNTYFLVRHGESEANAAGIISSNPSRGCVTHGLTAKGVKQAEAAGDVLKSWVAETGKPFAILSSDFTRARETAQVIARKVSDEEEEDQVKLEPSLRERNFGTLEGTSNENYGLVWAFDKDDVYHEEYESESVGNVAIRSAQVLVRFESTHQGYGVILVAHGDVLQILRSTVEAERPPALHRSGRHLGTASVTQLRL